MTDDFSPLTTPDHWLGWLGDDPARAVREEIESILRQQVPSAVLDWVRLLDEPRFLTGGRKSPDDPQHLIVTRAGLAVRFELQVSSESGLDRLSGVFSWVAAGLDGTRRDRVHFDLHADFETTAERLTVRLYELDEPSESESP